ncbi:uncharacterized protein I206_101392 [Kwoniella pini CBS 10737]|uniref:Uncharacterized protein n=1 Tax=Kwoniella pini CBS 10737 TaxID=1296096 RepID=A0A1B9HWU8_9TREE|nr:uncharacterized protein I206_06638 [Kwoniella pini CBS 10737]OCF47732.1 hypothetical protein I206_06638 [Kwoniella pini CBS 10737]
MSNPLDAPSSPSPQPETPIPETTDDLSPSTNIDSSSKIHQPLAIEDSKEAQSSIPQKEEEVHVLDLGEGNIIKLDKLGPMIINSDGTLSRIQNWQDLHPIEQKRTVRLLVKKRNLVRLKKLDKENKAEEGNDEPLTALKEEGSQAQ